MSRGRGNLNSNAVLPVVLSSLKQSINANFEADVLENSNLPGKNAYDFRDHNWPGPVSKFYGEVRKVYLLRYDSMRVCLYPSAARHEHICSSMV